MRFEPLGLPQRDSRGPERLKRACVAFEERSALHEVEDAEARGEAGRARGREHVVRAADIIADGLGRVVAEEDGTGVADFRLQRQPRFLQELFSR